MINVQQLEFNYPKSIFRFELDELSVKAGESVAIIGPSGCGKTTLMSLIAGILPCQTGNIIVNNIPIHTLNETQRRKFRVSHIGSVFQDFALIDYLTVYDNILHPYRINNKLKLENSIKIKARDLANTFAIEHCLPKYIHNISQGELQRSAICRALINQPKVILADEPTGNLDPDNKKWVLKVLQEYCKANNAALLVATHDHNLLDQFSAVIDLRVTS